MTSKEPLLLEFLRRGTWFGVTDEKHLANWRSETEQWLQHSPERYYYPPSMNGRLRLSYHEPRST